ncbi:MAG: UvrD-helicase domain-containing protein, partial [Rickettsiales bacterium]|nr:UvrD-helicase domain-containing protein [Rickettsiales bacterium]
MAERRDGNRSALEDVASSLWVSASAGSGKTTILMRRLLCLILNGVEVSRIVCITYTRTGAQEIKERTYSSLSRLAIMAEKDFLGELREIVGPDSLTPELLRRARGLFAESVDRIDELRIFTIHSFCQQLISRFPLEAGIPHNFEIIDEYQSSDLIEESIEDLLRNMNPDSEICHHLGSLIFDRNEEDLYDFIDHLVSRRKKFDPLGKFDYRKDLGTIFRLEDTDPEKILESFLGHDCSEILSLYETFVELDPSPRQEKNLEIVRNFMASATEDSRDSYLNLFLTREWEKRKLGNIFTKKFDTSRGYLENIFVLEQERCRNFVQRLENARCYGLTVAMVEVAREVIENYGRLKRRRGFLDFDDLTVVALELLQNTEYSAWIGYKLDGEIEHILLDEAQDTSTLQWEIVGSLANEFFSGETANARPRSLFVVGDEKQSIFRFQGANPKMFSEKYNFYRDLLESSPNPLSRLDLRYSYRSVDTILKFVDALFRDQRRLEKISTLGGALEHHCTRIGTGLVELWPPVQAQSSEREAWRIDFDNGEDVKKQEILARLIVARVMDLVGSDRTIVDRNGENRKIHYGDILILVRNRNPIFLSYLLKNFNGHGIPNSGLDRLNLFEHILVEDFLSLLTFILFQDDDLSLANIVKSPFLDMTEEDLYIACRYRIDHGLSLFRALEKTHEEKYRLLERIIERSHHLGVYELCFYVLEDCGVRKNIGSRFSSDSNDILNRFLLLVQHYEGNNNASLLDFLYFLGDRKNEIKKDLGSSSIDQVRIMTIHASKGLQAPVVFIADANSAVDQSREKILWTREATGHEIPIYMTPSHSDVMKTLREADGEELYGEYLRLLYVAVTRAENELYICSLAGRSSAAGGPRETRTTWYDLAREALLALNARERE